MNNEQAQRIAEAWQAIQEQSVFYAVDESCYRCRYYDCRVQATTREDVKHTPDCPISVLLPLLAPEQIDTKEAVADDSPPSLKWCEHYGGFGPPFPYCSICQPVYQLHYTLNGRTVVVQKPLTDNPTYTNVVVWGKEALGVDSLEGASVQLILENADGFIGQQKPDGPLVAPAMDGGEK